MRSRLWKLAKMTYWRPEENKAGRGHDSASYPQGGPYSKVRSKHSGKCLNDSDIMFPETIPAVTMNKPTLSIGPAAGTASLLVSLTAS